MQKHIDAVTAAQVAVEAVANDRDAYDESTRLAVLRNGEDAGVADIYLDLIR